MNCQLNSLPEEVLGTKFLIVDDDDKFRQRLEKALLVRRFTVRTAANAPEALELLKRFAPDCAIVDLKMPGPNGLVIVKQIATVYPQTKIVVLTGYGSISTAVESIRCGALDYLTKPADIEQILQTLQGGAAGGPHPLNLDTPSLEQVEWEHINRVLEENSGNISRAAKALGLHRRSLQRKLQRA